MKEGWPNRPEILMAEPKRELLVLLKCWPNLREDLQLAEHFQESTAEVTEPRRICSWWWCCNGGRITLDKQQQQNRWCRFKEAAAARQCGDAARWMRQLVVTQPETEQHEQLMTSWFGEEGADGAVQIEGKQLQE